MAPLQRVTVAQCDQRQLEGARLQIWPGGLGKQRGISRTSTTILERRLHGLKRKIRIGATPKGHGRPVRPTTAGGARLHFWPEGLGRHCGSSRISARILERRYKVKEKKTDWRHSKGSRTPSATKDSWRAPNSIFCLEDSGDIAGVRENQQRF